MPRTKDRSGSTLLGGAIDRDFSRKQISVRWSVRLVDMAGDPLTPASWTYYQVPRSAIMERSRTQTLGGGPARLTLVLAADKLPIGVVPARYQRIEIDRIRGFGHPNAWPYFTGVVDQVENAWVERGGATIKTYQVEAFDVLQRAKGRHVETIAVSPQQGTAAIYQMIGIVKEVRGSLSAVGPSLSQDMPGAIATLAFGSVGNNTLLSPNADLTAPYTEATHYNFTTSSFPARIDWTASGPAAGTTVYYRYFQIQYFGIRRHQGGTLPYWFVCPYGRDHRDTFQTEVSSYNAGTTTITPKDPSGYSSTNGLLDPADGSPKFSSIGVQREYLSITDSDGTESIVEIASTNAAGDIVLTGAPTFTPAAGDPIRLITTEVFPAWEEFGQRVSGSDRNQVRFFDRFSSTTINEGAPFSSSDTTLTVTSAADAGVGNTILIDQEILVITGEAGNDWTVTRGANGTTAASHADGTRVYPEFRRNLFKPYPNLGIAICTGRHWDTSHQTMITASPLLGAETGSSADPNRVEEAIKDILGQATGGLALFRDADFNTFLTDTTLGPTGSYMKNFVRYQVDCADLLRELKDSALPANAHITGERDGKISIKPYFQAATPDLLLQAIVDIRQEDGAEPATAVIVICEDEKPVNQAPAWYQASSGVVVADTYKIVDGNTSTSLAVQQTSANTRGIFQFGIPAASPGQAFPLITEIKIFGVRGFVTAYATQGGNDIYLPGVWQVDINRAGGEITIPGEQVARAAAVLDPAAAWTLTIQVEADNSALVAIPLSAGTVGELTEIEIWSKRVQAWRAELTADTAKVGSAYHPTDALTQFGSIFVQATPGSSSGAGTAGEQVSYLWAPATYLQRVCPDFGATAATTRHRVRIIRLVGVSQFQARSLAEDYLLEETFRATPFRVTALLDDRVEIGDTLAVPLPDGTVKVGLCEGYGDQGDLTAEVAQYVCTDRSATNRAMDIANATRTGYTDQAVVGLAVAG